MNNTFICEFCNRQFLTKNGWSQHRIQCKENPNRSMFRVSKMKGIPSGKPGWNTGLTKETDERILKYSISLSKSTMGHLGRIQSDDEKRRRKETIKKNKKTGGYRRGSGRGKKGWYKGFFCDSSWELAYVIYCLEHNIDIKRNTEKRKYIFEGKVKNYLPDFIVEGHLIEIKGYKTKEWADKLEANPDVKVLYEKDLKFIFDYVISKYGKDFIKLYGSATV
jgi:hypothetical protein